MDDRPITPFKAPTDATSWIVQLTIVALCMGLSLLIGEARGWAIGTSVGAIAILIELSWPLRKLVWFWCAVAVFAAIHLWAVLSLDWSWIPATDDHRSGLKGLALLFWVDLFSMAGVVYGVYRLIYGKPAQSIEPSVDELPRYSDHDMTW
jgi:hypothetical protein